MIYIGKGLQGFLWSKHRENTLDKYFVSPITINYSRRYPRGISNSMANILDFYLSVGLII